MMKHEFESLANTQVTPEEYRIIEDVYMNFDFLFPAKEDIAFYYHCFGMNGIINCYTELEKVRCERKDSEKREEILRISNENLISRNNGLFSAIANYAYLKSESLFTEENYRSVLHAIYITALQAIVE